MIRFALFLLLVYGLYRLVKGLFGAQATGGRRQKRGPSFDEGPRQVSEMVQDPVCKVYVPKKEALHLVQGGTSHYFCSSACREAFQKKQG